MNTRYRGTCCPYNTCRPSCCCGHSGSCRDSGTCRALIRDFRCASSILIGNAEIQWIRKGRIAFFFLPFR